MNANDIKMEVCLMPNMNLTLMTLYSFRQRVFDNIFSYTFQKICDYFCFVLILFCCFVMI